MIRYNLSILSLDKANVKTLYSPFVIKTVVLSKLKKSMKKKYKKVNIKIRRFIAQWFYIPVFSYFKIKFSFISFDRSPPIIILTPGKVGSSSIYETLKEVKGFTVVHLHHMSFNGIKESKKLHLESDRKSLPLHLIISSIFREKLQKYKGVTYIICLVREPISRAISSFFQNSEFYKKAIESSDLSIDIDKVPVLLNDIFDKNICIELESWFFTELESEFGFDIFKEYFDDKLGYLISTNKDKKVKLLLMKMESMNGHFSKAIGQFLPKQTKQIKLGKSNVGESKYYFKEYSEIRKTLKIDTDILKKIIGSKYFNPFYPDKKEDIFKNWS